MSVQVKFYYKLSSRDKIKKKFVICYEILINLY